MENQNENLICPISFDLFIDPIQLPCCGRAVSKDQLIACFNNSKKCPLCSQNIDHFDPTSAPICINLNYMVNEARDTQNQNKIIINNNIDKNPQNFWKAKLDIIDIANISNKHKKIGRLNIECTNDIYKNLLFAVVDTSGSMGGTPIEQCKFSLKRFVDFTYKYNHLITVIITYDDRATNFIIDKNNHYEIYGKKIDNISHGGGTNFGAAFNEIIKVCSQYSNNTNVLSMNCIFLTDGQDGSNIGRDNLISMLTEQLQKSWSKDSTIHTIGFGSGHDSILLDKLRKTGSKEGAYRFADNKEDNDVLSGKINSVLDIVATTVSVPFTLKLDNFPPIIHNDNNIYWLNLSDYDLDNLNNLNCNILINNTEEKHINLEISSQNNNDIYNKWYSYLMDNMISELMILNNKPDSFEKNLHCEIIRKRILILEQYIDKSYDEYSRLINIQESLELISNNNKLNDLKLKDMKYEGIFKTTNVPKQNTNNNNNNIGQKINKPIINNIKARKYWITIDRPKYKRCTANENSDEIFRIIGNKNPVDGCIAIRNCRNLYAEDKNMANALVAASGIGKCAFVAELLECGVQDATNKFGHNSADLAILFGQYNTLDVLLKHNILPTLNTTSLLMTCLSNGYCETAKRLVNNNLVDITPNLISCAPNYIIVNWLTNMANTSVDINTAIINGMVDQVEEKINTLEQLSWKPIIDVLILISSQDQLKIIDLLLKNNKLNVNEEIEYNGEIICPLFIVCEKGNIHMFKLLKKYITDFKNIVNKQYSKGTTLLWISVCNGHIDIAMELLNYNADPNISNLKGDSPLIPCCQKGYINLVELLLEYGAKLEIYNQNRDNPILICCRTGQHMILDKLLSTLDKKSLEILLNTYAEIDGFVPLLAATELDKVECIKTCLKFGANIETKTEIDCL